MPLGKLPKDAKKIWESVYKTAKKDGDSVEKAAKKAWGAVKNAGWHKDKEGNWVKKSELIEFSMHITKASLDSGIMRWAATNSDADWDSYNERMSLELYADFLEYINGEKELAEEFKSIVYSDYWKGGMPYLSISHYPDLNGKAVPGKPLEVFVDGIKLKAKGILFDSPLGHSVYRSLKEDKNKNSEDKIRISIGFLDLAHKHGENGNVWVRQDNSICLECLSGIGDKIYVKGCLVHLALTRVPVNKRTEMVLEEKADMTKKKTRKEDAASIVGEEEATKIEMASQISKQRSDVLVEMSDVTDEETKELIDETEGKTEIEESVNQENPVPVEETEKSDTEPEEVEKAEPMMAEPMMLPYGGATSMKEAESYVSAQKEAIHLMDMWSVFSNVVWNIMDRSDVDDKRAVLKKAVDEFKSALSAKAMLTFSEATVSKSEVAGKTETHRHELQPAVDSLLEIVDNSLVLESNEQRAEVLNPAMQTLGKAITDWIESKSVAQEPPAQNNNENNLLKDIRELIQPISDGVKELSQRVGVLEAKATVQSVEPKPRIPTPRTFPPQIATKSVATEIKKPLSVDEIAKKSVGL